jgi:cyclophilin family peptidyl-prolyl cis-trans isomerase
MARIIVALVAIAALSGAGYWFVFMRGQSAESLNANATLNYDQYGQPQDQTQAQTQQTAGGTESTTNTNQKAMKATLHTNKGNITIELLGSDAPNTVANFAKLAKEGFYDGTKFHRVIAGFMIQGGDPLSKDDSMAGRWGTGGPGYQFADEIHANNKNAPGTISMANAGPNTNGSQFFINTAANNFLDTKHTVFGKVVTGMEVVKAIEGAKTGQNDRPLEAMVINSITIE